MRGLAYGVSARARAVAGRVALGGVMFFAVLGSAAGVARAAEGGISAKAQAEARAVLETAGVRGGFLVHLVGEGSPASADFPAALRAAGPFLVHAVWADAEAVARARTDLAAAGLYGPVTVDRLTGSALPYADGTVRLLVAERLGPVPMAEVMRVLAPGGVVCVRGAGKEGAAAWRKTVKPRPEEIDEWTHALHDPSNNAVARDTVVGPPRHLQWVAGPRWDRSHDHLSIVSAVVSANGRIFAILDEGPMAAVALPSRWRLVARDAANGVLLWKREVSP